MKFSKTIYLLFVATILTNSCLQAGKKESPINSDEVSISSETDHQEFAQNEDQTLRSDKQPRLKYFNILDTRDGTPIERYPFPATWEQHTGGEFAYTGPNGVKVISDKGMNFAYSTDPTALQLYQNVGWQVKYPLSMDQVLDQIIMPYADQINRKMTKKYPLPQIKEFDQNLDQMLFKVQQGPKQLETMGIEWVDPDGTQWLTVLHYQIEQGNNGVFWSYRGSAIGSDPAHFEQSKLDYLNGLLNRQINTQWIRSMNQQNEYTIRKSNESHARREAEFQAGRERRQKEWEADQEVRARRQEHISDVILGKTNIVNPENGEKQKVDHKSNYYWVNSDGKYVGTDDYKYDPNKDDYINNRTWKAYKIDQY